MLRLLQGDVGSGKTVVALEAMLIAVEAGAQAAMLAPTEILARQHYETLRAMTGPIGVSIALLTGRDKGRARESILMGLVDGSIQIVVGTHAIFQETVAYRNLGLVVIDEQHRFGVGQRLMLSQKGRVTPHCLAMTATPIPRTLVLAQYGEMEVSQLDEMPPGRQAIDTRVVSLDRLSDVADGLARHLESGQQAYWVCPMVRGGEHENEDLAAAEARFASLKARFGDAAVLVHGQLKPELKDAAMERFARGEARLLVATTVIEVGVDVPSATLMVIEQAERFGLAQLHQLPRPGRPGQCEIGVPACCAASSSPRRGASASRSCARRRTASASPRRTCACAAAASCSARASRATRRSASPISTRSSACCRWRATTRTCWSNATGGLPRRAARRRACCSIFSSATGACNCFAAGRRESCANSRRLG
jgi:RecG-like helicase